MTRTAKLAQAEAAGLRFPIKDLPKPGEALEVAPGVLWARLALPMALDHVNVYLLEDDDGWAVVDTGMNIPAARENWASLLAGAMGGRPVTRIIVTHLHPDHIGLAGWLAQETGAPIWCTRTTYLYGRMLQLDRWEEPPEEAARFYRAAGYGDAEMARMRSRAKYGFARVVHPVPVGFRRIVDGETLRIGDRDWRVVVGHGHAPEHSSLVCDAEALMLSGDQILPRITSNIGVYPTEPEGDPLGDWLESCRLLESTLDPDLLVLPGHTEPFTGVRIRLGQLIAHHGEALSRLMAHLAEPRRAVDCFDVLFDRKITDQLLGFATIEAVAHLNHLCATGRATGELRDGVRWVRAQPAEA